MAVQLVGCGGEDGDEGESSTGGTNQGTGGDTTATGGAPSGTGGAPSGGATASGGADATGGADPGSGGDTASGGDTSSGGDGNTEEACTGDVTGISTGTDHPDMHEHAFKLTLAEIEAGVQVELLLEPAGGGNHTHSVTITADDLATLRDGGTVEKTSGGGHIHQVTLTCAG